MGIPVKFEWYPNKWIHLIILFLSMYLWKITVDYSYCHRDELPMILELLAFASVFVYYWAIFKVLNYIFKFIYATV